MTSLADLLSCATFDVEKAIAEDDLVFQAANAACAKEWIRDMMEQAAPLVLEYMQGGHHDSCGKVTYRQRKGLDDRDPECTCGYDALRKALGMEGE